MAVERLAPSGLPDLEEHRCVVHVVWRFQEHELHRVAGRYAIRNETRRDVVLEGTTAPSRSCSPAKIAAEDDTNPKHCATLYNVAVVHSAGDVVAQQSSTSTQS